MITTLRKASPSDFVSAWTHRLRGSLRSTAVLVTITWAGSTSVSAQVLQGSHLACDSHSSAATARFRNLDVDPDPLTSWAATRARRASTLTPPWDRLPEAPSGTRSGAHARSKTRIALGAIVGAVGGFFAGGFLGAHIEGDRCNCDDPGVRGFLIGAPVGAVGGGIVGGKFLF